MKKIIVLFVSLMFIGVNMKAEKPFEAKKPYVQWLSQVPDPSVGESMKYLFFSLNGKAIAGATVYSVPQNYISVWGKAMYDKINNDLAKNDYSHFSRDFSKGGEVNHGIDANSNAVATGTLPAGVPIITYYGIAIGKWGTNGCLNALLPPAKPTSYDPDELAFKPDGQKPPTNQQPNTGTNININTGTGNNQEVTWSQGYGIYSTGRNDRTNDMLADFTLFKMAQDSKECCGQTAAAAPSMAYATAMPAVQTMQVAAPNMGYAQAAPATQVVMMGQQKVPFGQTFLGNTLATMVGTFGGTLASGAIIANNYPHTTTIINGGGGGPWNGGN